MGKVEDAVRSEIMRLVRKELRAVVTPLGREVRDLKRGMGRVTRAVATLERTVGGLAKEAAERKGRLEGSEEEVRQSRMSGGLIKKLRARLGITQTELAALVGVSPGAVTQWETGVISPRGQNRAALVALRKLGRRDVVRLLEQKGVAPSRRRRARRAAE